MSHRVLIVSPHFPPINAPDHQRVRMSLPYFEEFGWESHILTVQPDCIEGVRDPLLEQTVPSHIPVCRTGAFPVKYTKRIGMSSLGLRCFPSLLRAGDRILAKEKFDLVYFSTTVFTAMALGPKWHKRFGVPYVLDFQDPWLSDYHKRPGSSMPPGGQFKYGFAQFQAQMLEPLALRHASHVISVSSEYPKTLLQRYPWLYEDQFTVLPFGAPETDFKQLPSLNVQQTIFDPKDGKRHWVYVGRAGSDMALALRALFSGIQSERDRHPEPWNSVKLHFVGTSYAPGDRAVKTVEPIAQEVGIADLVEEHPHRVAYFEALQILVDSDAILLIGSDDPSYTASKLYPCILAQKPIFALFHQQSSVVNILQRCHAGQIVTFNSNQNPADLLTDVTAHLNWLFSIPKGYQPETNWSEFQPYTAREMTRQQCAVFDQCLRFANKL
ncbi:hypothetical protein H6F96_28925 [Microcoleus sp. FACHB-53]|nr:hypothetical protein [Microcoleus sp. FACHB-53]